MRRWFSQTGFVTKEVDGVCACVSMCYVLLLGVLV